MPTKSATKKPVAKKKAKATPVRSAVKKTTKKATKKPLVYADNQTSFWVRDGQIINSLIALRDALATMPKDVYQYHAGGSQNDFSLWVDVVLCDSECAAALNDAKTPAAAKTVVVRHLKHYAL